MTLDEALRETVEQTVRTAVERALAERLAGDAIQVMAPADDRPLDSKALQERGYTEQESYALLRAHGHRMPGGRRIRIAKSVLERIERGELSPEITQAFTAHKGQKGARPLGARSSL